MTKVEKQEKFNNIFKTSRDLNNKVEEIKYASLFYAEDGKSINNSNKDNKHNIIDNDAPIDEQDNEY